MPQHPVPPHTVAEVSCITTNRSTDLIGAIKEVGADKRKCDKDEEIADGEIVGNPMTPGGLPAACAISDAGPDNIRKLSSADGTPLAFPNLSAMD